MRILFAGTPALAVPSLRAAAHAHDVVGVLTAPDRPSGRGREPARQPVAEAAASLGCPLLQPLTLDAAFIETVRALSADLLVAAAYGRIFREPFLALFPLGAINIHPSLLPLYRGPSPITAAILHGDTVTGVTIQRMALRFDTGDILAQSRHPLSGTETTGSLSEELAAEGAALLAEVLAGFAEGKPPAARSQKEALATYCRPLAKEDGRVDWNEPAAVIERKVRAYDPWPRATTVLGPESLLVLKSHVYTGRLDADEERREAPGSVLAADRDHGLLVRTGEGLLAVERLQLQFKKPQDWRAFVNGHPGIVGTRLGA
jgi:methionyl-tRNA formyltransferase